MSLLRISLPLLSLGVIVNSLGAVYAQDYPTKPIRIITSNPGGGNDIIARIIAQGLTERLNQQIVVDNRPAGPMSGELVSKASADGYTLLVGSNTIWTAPLLQPTPFDPLKDFEPITITSRVPEILVVHPSVGAHSVKELIEIAKSRPGQLNYASSGIGSGSHLAMEMFKSMAGINIVRVPYKGGTQTMTFLVSGEVQLIIDDTPTLMPYVKNGKVTALAVTTAQPSTLAPGLPTMASSGVPGYEAEGLQGLYAPAKTPVAIIRRLNQEVVRILDRKDVKSKLFDLGYETVGSSPEEFAARMRLEIAKATKVIQDAGIHAE